MGTAVLPSTFGLGDTMITWKFVDGASNATTCTQIIKVEDKSAPVIDCSKINPITAEISDNSCRIALNITVPKSEGTTTTRISRAPPFCRLPLVLATPPLHGSSLMQPPTAANALSK